ncbi:MAG: hypothetical protein ACRC3B_17820 [Bacteroidia bacterium]
MRIFTFFLLVIVCGCSKEYYRNRSYGYSTGFTWSELRLNSDSTFNYSEGHCTGSCGLSGKYVIKEKNIYFSYDLPDTPFSNDIIHHTPTVSDSCQIRIQLMEMENNSVQPIPVTVLLITNADSAFRKGIVADFDGKAGINLHRSAFPLTISFINIGYKSKAVQITEPVDMNDTIFLQPNNNWCGYVSLPSDSCGYRIIKMNSRRLDLRMDSKFPETDSSSFAKSIKLKSLH